MAKQYTQEEINAAMEALERENERKAKDKERRAKQQTSLKDLKKKDPQKYASVRRQQVKQQVKQRLLLKKAKAAGITVSSQELDAAVEAHLKKTA